jgi:site-specific DNA-methyltransferase (adenine-specific)
MSEGKKEILLGDCLELMKDIPNGSIDAIITDPPYGTTACKWDTIIPFEPLWEQYERIIKPNGAIVLFGSQPFTSALIMSNPKLFKYELIWDKKTGLGFLDSKFRPLKSHENIIVFGLGGCSNGSKIPMKYNPQGLIETTKQNKNTKSNILNSEPKKRENLGTTHTNYPKSILTFSRVRSGNHPTQKPVELFEYLIKTYTNEGDLVLDNAAGSGTTAIACLKTKRQFIVMEKEQEYYDIILKRVADFNKKFETQTLFENEM